MSSDSPSCTCHVHAPVAFARVVSLQIGDVEPGSFSLRHTRTGLKSTNAPRRTQPPRQSPLPGFPGNGWNPATRAKRINLGSRLHGGHGRGVGAGKAITSGIQSNDQFSSCRSRLAPLPQTYGNGSCWEGLRLSVWLHAWREKSRPDVAGGVRDAFGSHVRHRGFPWSGTGESRGLAGGSLACVLGDPPGWMRRPCGSSGRSRSRRIRNSTGDLLIA